jgi:PAS domain S-box-containing protein
MIYRDDFWVYANPAAEIISGYTQEELYQMRYWDFVHPTYRELVKKNGQKKMRGEYIEKEYEFKILSKDGITKWVYLTGQRIKFQEKDSVLITVADITKQKTNEFELEEAKNRAEASDRLKTAFLNNISHEIRTPLNGIVNFGEMILDQDLTPRERKNYHEVLMESTNRLLTTVTDYMDISLIVSGNQIVRNSDFTLNEIFKQVLNFQNDKINHKSIVFSQFIDKNADKIVINSDRDILIKILNQLISNAIKYTPNEGNIRINCAYHVDSLKIEIIDNGEGISEDVLEKIFSTFSQGDISSTRKHEGSGLGLAISKGFVDLLKGTIAINSTKGKGTTVTISIPCKKIITSTSDIQMETSNTTTHPNSILIVEDEATNSLFLKLLLQKNGCEVDTVVNGKQAVDMVKIKSNYAVILMDIKMPIMDGFEATRQIKAIYPKIPIIATTAHAMSGDEDKALNAGCDDYITKPISKDLLFEKLAKYGVI